MRADIPLVLAVVLCVGVSAAAGTQQQQQQPASLAWAPFTFKAASGSETEADSATLVVPAVRAPRRGSVSIPIVRFRATASAPGAPIIYLSGGTGSGIAAAGSARYAMFQSLRELGDVITLDLRGSSRSQPRIACSPAVLDVSAPLTHAAIVTALRANAERCADSLSRAGAILSGHNVREVVEDIESLRVALDAPTVRLIGISTGTQLALEYMRRHPDRVHSTVLAGVQAPDQNVHLPSGQESVIRSLAASLRVKGDSSDFVRLLTTVLDTLDRQPRTVSVSVPGGSPIAVSVNKLDVQLIVAAMLGDRRQMAALPRLLGAARQGNYTPLASVKMAAARQGFTSAFEALMDCQSSAPPARAARSEREARSALLGRATFDFPEHCSAWGVQSLPASYRAPVRSRVPTLLISGTLDGRTPVANALEAMRGLPNAAELVLDGASHGDDLFLASSAIVPAIARFLRTGGRDSPRYSLLSVR